jgi:hypothetical protein
LQGCKVLPKTSGKVLQVENRLPEIPDTILQLKIGVPP